MKRIFCIITASIILLSLAGCAAKAKANTTYTGTVSAISADSITLATENGEVTISLTANTQMTMGDFGGFMYEGDFTMPADGQRPDRQEMPEGNFEKPEGGFERPEGNFTRPEGEMSDFSQFPEGQMPQGMTPPEGGFGGSFEGFGDGFGGMDFSVIPVGTSVTVTTGSDKSATTISMNMNFQNFGGQMPSFQN